MKTYTLVHEDEMEGPPPPTDEEFDILYPLPVPVQKMTDHPAMVPSLTTRRATDKALATVELLEMILEKVDMHTLRLAQRVNTQFRICICDSSKLQLELFQEPCHPDCERVDFRFNHLLMNNKAKIARDFGIIIEREQRGDSGLWEFRVFITTPQLLQPPRESSVYRAGFCTAGRKCLEKGPDLHDGDMHLIKIYYRDAQDLNKPIAAIPTMSPSLGVVFSCLRQYHPNMLTTEEELDDGLTIGGYARERFMHGRSVYAAIAAEEELAAEEFRKNFREHRAKRRAGKFSSSSSS